MQMLSSHNIILPKYLRMVKKKGSKKSKTRARRGGANTTPFLAVHFALQNTHSKLVKKSRRKKARQTLHKTLKL